PPGTIRARRPAPRRRPQRSSPARAGRGRSRVPEHVTHAAHRLDAARFATLFELAAQIPDVDGERVGPRVEVKAPHAVKQDLAREHLAGVAQERLEEVELDP